MSKKSIVYELQTEKTHVFESIKKLEATVGHYACKKKDKSISKENLETYFAYDTEIETFHGIQDNIIALDLEYKELKETIKQQKESLSQKEQELHNVYVSMGLLLFENYSPAIADVFGKTYTSVCVANRKIEEVSEKEVINDESQKTGFVSRILTFAKKGATKTQVSLYEQKRDSLLLHGAKDALDSGNLEKALLKDIIHADVKALFDEHNVLQNSIKDLFFRIETLNLNCHAIKNALEKAGATMSSQRRLATIDKQIEEKHKEQDDFSAKIGHDYVIRYVGPDGEQLIDYPKGIESVLQEIQTHNYNLVSLARKIEIENSKINIEKILSETDSLQSEKEKNMQKIEQLTRENQEINNTIAQKNDERSEFEKQLKALINEEKASKK